MVPEPASKVQAGHGRTEEGYGQGGGGARRGNGAWGEDGRGLWARGGHGSSYGSWGGRPPPQAWRRNGPRGAWPPAQAGLPTPSPASGPPSPSLLLPPPTSSPLPSPPSSPLPVPGGITTNHKPGFGMRLWRTNEEPELNVSSGTPANRRPAPGR